MRRYQILLSPFSATRAFFAACLLVATGSYLWTRFPMLVSVYAINDDASQHLIWLNPSEGYSPYDDTIAFSRLIVPRGYALLVSLVGRWFTNHTTIILVDLIRCLGILWLLFRLVIHRGKGSWLGLLLFYILFHLASTIGDVGMPRSFATLFLLMACVAEARIGRRYLLWGAAILLSSLFYPPTTVILGVTFLFVHIFQWVRTRQFPWPGIPSSAILLVSVLLAAACIMSASRAIHESPIGGSAIDRDFILHDPHASPEGRANLRQFLESPVYVFLRSGQFELRKVVPVDVGGQRGMFLLVIGLGAVALLATLRGSRDAGMSLALYLSGIVLYGLAVLIALRLYQPNRYVQYTWLPSLMMLLLALLPAGRTSEDSWHWPRRTLVAALLAMIAYSLTPPRMDFRGHRALYENLSRLVAPGQRIATNSLALGNMIPWFTGRSVYVSYENLHAVYYRSQIRLQDQKMANWQRMFDLRSSDSLSSLLRECRIDGLLLQEPFHAIIDTPSIPRPYARGWNPDNALGAFVAKRKPQAEFMSAGKRYRWYDLRGVDITRP